MPLAFNRATFYSTFVLMHNIADHFSPPNCPSHCNLPPKSDNNVLSTGEQGSEIFFFNKSWIFRGSLWNLSPWQRIGKGRPLPFNISTVQQSAELQKKSTSIEAEANNATTRATRSSEAEEELEFGENICVETRKDGWSCVVSLLHCVDCQPLTPLSRSTILLSTSIAITRGWIQPREWHPLSNRCNYHSLVARIRGSIVADGFLGYKFY